MNARCSTTIRRLWKSAWLIGGVLSLAACFGGGSDGAPVVPNATFRGLGVLPGYASSSAHAVSSDGSVVVGTATAAAGNHQAFLWSAQTGMAGLGFMPGGTLSNATAVSADGTVVVGDGNAASSDPPTSHAAFRWTASAGLQRLDSLPGPAPSLCSCTRRFRQWGGRGGHRACSSTTPPFAGRPARDPSPWASSAAAATCRAPPRPFPWTAPRSSAPVIRFSPEP